MIEITTIVFLIVGALTYAGIMIEMFKGEDNEWR